MEGTGKRPTSLARVASNSETEVNNKEAEWGQRDTFLLTRPLVLEPHSHTLGAHVEHLGQPALGGACWEGLHGKDLLKQHHLLGRRVPALADNVLPHHGLLPGAPASAVPLSVVIGVVVVVLAASAAQAAEQFSIAIVTARGLPLPSIGPEETLDPLPLDAGSAIVRLALLALAAIVVVTRILLLQGQLLCTGQN